MRNRYEEAFQKAADKYCRGARIAAREGIIPYKSEKGAWIPSPFDGNGWTCAACGTVNKGKFCAECGAKKPEDAPKYKCDKCGWEPEDPTKPPKFCPECGDPFDESDLTT